MADEPAQASAEAPFTLLKPEYPQRTCREAVWGEHGQAYGCELPDIHPGPHASQSSLASLKLRQGWEERNPGWEKAIGSSDFIV